MTAAVLSSAFRGSITGHGTNSSVGTIMHSEQFLKEIGLILGQEDISHPKENVGDDGGDAACGGTRLPRSQARATNNRGTSETPVDLAESATLIQAQVRRYLQQSHYRIQQLEQRLHSIAMERDSAVAHIERRTQRKLRRIRRRYDKEEEQQDVQYQKVTGIVQYLKRDKASCQKELESHRSFCRALKTGNQRLRLAHERTLQATNIKQQQVKQLEAANDELKARLSIQKDAIRQCQLQLQQEQRTGIHGSPRQPGAPRRRRQATNNKAKSYETSIHVNCVNEAEERCFHYRLVQDIYTLTPRSG